MSTGVLFFPSSLFLVRFVVCRIEMLSSVLLNSVLAFTPLIRSQALLQMDTLVWLGIQAQSS